MEFEFFGSSVKCKIKIKKRKTVTASAELTRDIETLVSADI